MTAIDHARYLSEVIGPRGSTTAQEAEAGQYAAEALRQAGLEPHTETFRSARSNWRPYALFSGLTLVSAVFFSFAEAWGAVVALVLSVLSLGSALLELTFRTNPIRWILPKSDSQNVWAHLPSRGEAQKKVVLIGHIDTHRTPLVFSSETWLKLFNALVPTGLVSSVVLIILIAIGLFNDAPIWRYLSLPSIFITTGLLLITLQADLTPYAPGANDNATGAGIVLSLAERLHTNPLPQTSVWAVLTGCEEVGCYGAYAFASSHKGDLEGSIWITLDSVGGKGALPTYLTKETFLLTTHSDPQLLALADKISSAHPDWGAQSLSPSGAFTEGVVGGRHGFRVFTMVNHKPGGGLPEWHQSSDVMENVDAQLLERTEAFVMELLKEIDGESGKSP
jgi:hypothetical protein